MQNDSPTRRFESAADAIAAGDSVALQRLLGEEPSLIHQRSTHDHGATLLHYVSANGVEDDRQKTPKNIVEIAEILLRAGADIHATANLYGHPCTTIELTATSVHPEKAGVQEALLQVLLEHGASLDVGILTACLGNGRLKAAQFLAANGAPLDLPVAAGLGRLDLVETLVETLVAASHNVDASRSNRKQGEIEQAFFFACQYGHDAVVRYLAKNGADTAAADSNGQSGLHWAVIGGHLQTVKLLLTYNPSLEVENIYGGTAFGQALWSAAHGGDPDVYVEILEALAAAGADIPERHQPIYPSIDESMTRHGSYSEPGPES